MTKGHNLERRLLGEWDDWMEFQGDFHNPKKGPYDSKLRQEVGAYCHQFDKEDYPNPEFLKGAPGDHVDKVIRDELDTSQNIVLDYTNKHFKSMLETLTSGKENIKALYSVALGTKPRKTGDPEHNEIADLHNELLQLQSLYGDGKNPNIDGMRKYVIGTAKEHHRDTIAYLTANRPETTLKYFETRFAAKSMQFQKMLGGEDGLSGRKVADYITGNIRKIQAEEKIERDADKRDDLKDEREELYLNISQNLYKAIK